jgi:DNA polymerase kappa
MSNNQKEIVNPYTKKKRKQPDGTEKEIIPYTDLVSNTSTNIGHAVSDNTKNVPQNTDNNNVSAQDQASALCISASDKAGMEGIDRERIATIILKESGNSAYIQQQRRRDEKVNERVRQLQQRLQEASPRDYRVTDELDETLRGYQQRQASRATCVVVDMDMFYMACELLSRPHLNDKPACVGKEMILTSNYVARRYGVRSAMAGFIGRKLVEQLSDGREKLIQVPSNFELYHEKSKIVNEVIREYDPHNMKAYSLDEVYLDIGPYLVLFLQHNDWTHEQIREAVLRGGEDNNKSDENKSNDEENYTIISPAEVMQFLQSQSSMTCIKAVGEVVLRLRQHVQKATGGLTCSAGIARTHTIAKIASDANKPNGQLVVDPVSTLEFVRALPVRKIPGIGRVTEKLLQQVCNIHTGLELYEKRGLVQFLFQPATADFLLKSSVGCSGEGSSFASFGTEQIEETSDHQKGISRERSFSPESDWALLNIKLEEISRMLSEDMKRKSVMGHTVTIKVKLATFDPLSRAQSQKQGIYIQNPEEISTVACELLSAVRAQYKRDYNQNKSKDRDSRFSVRLLGIRCSNLIEESSYQAKQKGKIEKFFTITPSSDNSPKCRTTSCGTNNGSEKNCMTEKKDEVNRKLLFNRYAKNQNGKGTIKDNAITITTTTTASTNTSDTKNAENRVHSPINVNTKNKTDVSTTSSTCVTIKTAFAAATATPNASHPQTNHCVNTDDKQEEANEEHVSCPICKRSFLAKNNAKFNTHIDACLNGDTVRKAIREQDCIEAQKSRKRQRLTDFWS